MLLRMSHRRSQGGEHTDGLPTGQPENTQATQGKRLKALKGDVTSGKAGRKDSTEANEETVVSPLQSHLSPFLPSMGVCASGLTSGIGQKKAPTAPPSKKEA